MIGCVTVALVWLAKRGATGIVTAEMVLMNKNVKTEHLLVRKLSTSKY